METAAWYFVLSAALSAFAALPPQAVNPNAALTRIAVPAIRENVLFKGFPFLKLY